MRRALSWNRWVPLFGAIVAALVGVAAAWNPILAGGAVGAAVVLLALVAAARRLRQVFLVGTGVLLVGYAFLGRGFAYIGIAPLYVGEIVLGIGLLALVLSGGLRAVFRSPVAWLIVVFMAWSAARTIPFIGTYQFDALRDAVLWLYALYAVLVGGFLLREGRLERVVAWYRRVMPWYLAWVPFAALVVAVAGDALPVVPLSTVPIIDTKPGDNAVHLAGAAVFLFLGLHRRGTRATIGSGAREWLWWLAWLLGAVTAAATNRGGMLAILAAAGLVVLLRPLANWRKVAALGAVLLAVFFVSGVSIDLGGRRSISAEQIFTNIGSILGVSQGQDLGATREWRLTWWEDIIDYTVFGDYFWTGKGYGINLADADGFQVNADGSLRSPHNGHLNILARTGVPGFALWIALQVAFGVSLFRAYLRARHAGRQTWANVNLWLLAYWLAFLVNASFDVYLEGPQGGIWFWSLMGVGIAVLETQRRLEPSWLPAEELSRP